VRGLRTNIAAALSVRPLSSIGLYDTNTMADHSRPHHASPKIGRPGVCGSNAAQPASDCRALFYSGSQCAQLNISPIGKGRKPSVGDERKSPLKFVNDLVAPPHPHLTGSRKLPRKRGRLSPRRPFNPKDWSNLASPSARQQHRPGA